MSQEPEDFITVEEAAERLRIGRTRAYVEARLYVESGGAEGIVPAIPVGRLYRVSVARLEEIAGGPLRSFHRDDKRTSRATGSASSDQDTPHERRADRQPGPGHTTPTAPSLFDR